mmetsp:Transcript_14549/g.42621  ORF Transcript_14549/g.42621 Transcript_14549/m.42621 type:complete len:326 (+) Transcript_14549:331-1308(+)
MRSDEDVSRAEQVELLLYAERLTRGVLPVEDDQFVLCPAILDHGLADLLEDHVLQSLVEVPACSPPRPGVEDNLLGLLLLGLPEFAVGFLEPRAEVLGEDCRRLGKATGKRIVLLGNEHSECPLHLDRLVVLDPDHPLLHEFRVDDLHDVLVEGVVREKEFSRFGDIRLHPRDHGHVVMDKVSKVPHVPPREGGVIALERPLGHPLRGEGGSFSPHPVPLLHVLAVLPIDRLVLLHREGVIPRHGARRPVALPNGRPETPPLYGHELGELVRVEVVPIVPDHPIVPVHPMGFHVVEGGGVGAERVAVVAREGARVLGPEGRVGRG